MAIHPERVSMTSGGPGDIRPSRNQRRDAAREKARQLRLEQRKKDRRNRVLLKGGIVVALVAVVAVVAYVITTSIPTVGPGPANMASDGLHIGEGMAVQKTAALNPEAKPVPSKPDPSGTVAEIRIYVDYLCPLCGDFDTTNSEQIANWVESGAATVEIHPVSVLTSKSAGTQYSLRAGNAAACVANHSPEDFYTFNSALFADQPAEGTAGLSDDELKDVVKKAGVSSNVSKIESCIDDGTYETWVRAATKRALAGPIPNSSIPAITSTPTVLVNGKQYVGDLKDPKEFASFVLQAAGETYSTSTPTPAPTS
jgi:protein-disulfide isomerase